ncbi:GAF domain-containing sensor histidine kinase [Arthrobacter agilis]|uniref:GAF domain-containing sensor histidine kinase n=1 Tax=Arthrobacter agilis TaxID=37921 RepID=UPI002787632D|nr:GAF domain-containing sensor histidine kinase [Arthrobacter agilis]MDQ0734875.1 signal transduction histidine kinase [Arthrobacter agilis]
MTTPPETPMNPATDMPVHTAPRPAPTPRQDGSAAPRDEALPPSGIENLLAAFAAIADDLGLETVLERVISAACRLVDARFGALGVIGPDRMLSHFITVGLDDDQIARIGSLPRGHGVLGLLITAPHPLRLADLRRHPLAYGFPAHHPQMTSFLGVPIRVHGTVFGNLYLTEKHGGVDFSDGDEQLLVSLASAAGVAIENSRLFDDATRRTRWLEGGSGAAQALLSQHNDARNDLELVTQHALHASQSVLALVLRDFGHQQGLICEAADGLGSSCRLGRRVEGVPALNSLAPTDRPLLLTGDDIGRVLPAASAGTIDAVLCSRLPGEPERHFLIVGRAPGAPAFTDVDYEMMRSFTSHVSLALELLKAHYQREEDAVLGDRDRIARDLHDLVIQRLFATGLSIQSLRKYTADPHALERINAVTGELDATIRELRDTIYSLRSIPRAEPTFTSTVFSLVADAFDGHDLEPVLQLSGPLNASLQGERADHVRAVLLEGLSNALRHAGARSITTALTVAGEQFELSISDDGRGFVDPARTSGLANMRHRAELCGGTLSVTSTPRDGTQVHLVLPLDDPDGFSVPGPKRHGR